MSKQTIAYNVDEVICMKNEIKALKQENENLKKALQEIYCVSGEIRCSCNDYIERAIACERCRVRITAKKALDDEIKDIKDGEGVI